MRAILKLLHIDPLKSQRKALERIRSTSTDAVRIQGKKVNARWLRQFMDYDPVPILQRIEVPVLVISGGHDMQVPPEDAAVIENLVAGALRTPGLRGSQSRPSPGPRLKGAACFIGGRSERP